MHGSEKNCRPGFRRKTRRKVLLEGPRRRWQNNINMGLKEIRCSINLVQVRIQSQAFVNMLMKFLVPQNATNFLST